MFNITISVIVICAKIGIIVIMHCFFIFLFVDVSRILTFLGIFLFPKQVERVDEFKRMVGCGQFITVDNNMPFIVNLYCFVRQSD